MSDASISNQFSDYYGVVLNHQHGGPLRWSATHQAWLRRTDARLADVDFAWAGEPVDGDEVDEDELAVALELAQTFRDQHHFCDRCWGAPSPVTHFITTDVAGDPTVYCVQRPSHDVVGARGGRGVKKHWGSPYGCMAAKAETVSGAVHGVSDHAIVAGFGTAARVGDRLGQAA